MRTLQIHAEKFSYKTMKKAIKNPSDPPSQYTATNALVVFTTIELDDDEITIKKAVEEIINHAQTIKANEIIIYPYAHLSNTLAPPEKAEKILHALTEKIMEKQWRVHKAPFGWYKQFKLEAAGHPLAELSRTISPTETLQIKLHKKYANKIINEYLPRFGLVIDKQKITIEKTWKDLIRDNLENGQECIHNNLPIKTELCDGANIVEMEILPEKKKLIEYIVKAKEKPENLFLHLKIMKKDNKIRINEPEIQALIGINKEKTYYLLNTLLIALIADRLKGLEKGENPTLPIEYSPIQAIILTIGKIDDDYIEKTVNEMKKLGLTRIIVDDTEKKIGDKIRYSGTRWIPYTILIGEREYKTKTVIVRLREKKLQTTVKINELHQYLENTMKRNEDAGNGGPT